MLAVSSQFKVIYVFLGEIAGEFDDEIETIWNLTTIGCEIVNLPKKYFGQFFHFPGIQKILKGELPLCFTTILTGQ